MRKFSRIFTLEFARRPIAWGDVVVLLAITVLIYLGVSQAKEAPRVIHGPVISLDGGALPLYAALSTARMAAAYVLSILFSLVYGYAAARSKANEQILIPLLDVLQSVPLLSFLPVILLTFMTIFPQRVATELASIFLIFTCQGWNITFAWYQSLTTVPRQLMEVGRMFDFTGWMTFKTIQLPFAVIGLIWNSMVSWAGGWFFLMAAEIFSVGSRDFRLPGLGAYLQAAADAGDMQKLALGVLTLVFVVVAMDQLVWRPLLVWSDRFRMELTQSDYPPTSWFYEALHSSQIARWFHKAVLRPGWERLESALQHLFPLRPDVEGSAKVSWTRIGVTVVLLGGLLYGMAHATRMLALVGIAEWWSIGVSTGATFLRVAIALLIALAWTIPLGVAIGTNRKLATWFQPLVQIVASIPATALFPAFLIVFLAVPEGLNLAAITLMLAGTQWYLLFNIIAGASTIPQELKNTAEMLQFSRGERWRTLILPAIFPYIVTGSIASTGGAWNASILAEYTKFRGQTYSTTGLGALISQATADAKYPLLLAATIVMIVTVVLINRLFWHRLYVLASERYRMD